MLLSVTLSNSATSSLDRWNVLCSILSTVLSMASWMGMDVYRDTTSRLHGYGSVLLLKYSVLLLKYKPGLNSREECTELNDLLF